MSSPVGISDASSLSDSFDSGNIGYILASTSHPIRCLTAFVPSFTQESHSPFMPRQAWHKAITSIVALRRLKTLTAASGRPGNQATMRSDLLVATGHEEGDVMLWSADTLSTVNSLRVFNSATVKEIFLTNTHIFVIIENGILKSTVVEESNLYVYDAGTMALEATLSGHEEAIRCLAVDPENENHLVTGGVDSFILEWVLPKQIPVAKHILCGMGTSKLLFVFGRYFLSGSIDGTIYLWNSDFGTESRVELSPIKKTSSMAHKRTSQLLKTLDPVPVANKVIERTSVGSLEGHAGQISVLQLESAAGGNLQDPLRGMSVVESAIAHPLIRTAVIVSACLGGVVQLSTVSFSFKLPEGTTTQVGHTLAETGISTAAFLLSSDLESKWKVKAHRMVVTDVCCDGTIFASGSTTDGVTFFHSKAMMMQKMPTAETGVRRLAIDGMRKLLLCGCDNGQLIVFCYENFHRFYENFDSRVALMGSANPIDPVVTVAILQPHESAITGILLERSTSGQWERALTVSEDNTIFMMDFNPYRDAKSVDLIFSCEEEIPTPPVSQPLSGLVSSSLLSAAIPQPPPISPLPPSAFLSILPSISLQRHIASSIAPVEGMRAFMFAQGSEVICWVVDSMKRKGENCICAPTAAGAKGGSNVEHGKEGKAPSSVQVLAVKHYAEVNKLLVSFSDCFVRFWSIYETGNLIMCDQSQSFKSESSDAADSRGSLDNSNRFSWSHDKNFVKVLPASPVHKVASRADHTRRSSLQDPILSQFVDSKGDAVVAPTSEAPIKFEGHAVTLFSEEIWNGVVAVVLTRMRGVSAFKTGSVCLIDSRLEKQVTGCVSLKFIGVQVCLLGFATQSTSSSALILAGGGDTPDNFMTADSESRTSSATNFVSHYNVLVMLRNGEIELLTGTSDPPSLTRSRTLCQSQLKITPEAEIKSSLPMPKLFFARLNSTRDPPLIDMLYINWNHFCSEAFSVSQSGGVSSEPFFSMAMFDSSSGGASAKLLQVTTWCPMYQCGQLAAIGLSNGIVTIVSEGIYAIGGSKPTQERLQEYRIVDIFYNGSLCDYQVESNYKGKAALARKKRCFICPVPRLGGRSQNAEKESPLCSCLAFSPSARILCIGYTSGIVQMYDATMKRVCRRISPKVPRPPGIGGDAQILHMEIFGREMKLLCVNRWSMTMHTIYNRKLRELNVPQPSLKEQRVLTSFRKDPHKKINSSV